MNQRKDWPVIELLELLESSWSGCHNVIPSSTSEQIASPQYTGGDVTISFGGASGIELSEAVTPRPSLQPADESVGET